MNRLPKNGKKYFMNFFCFPSKKLFLTGNVSKEYNLKNQSKEICNTHVQLKNFGHTMV